MILDLLTKFNMMTRIVNITECLLPSARRRDYYVKEEKREKRNS